jgi:adenine-specific DNA-methyltransferase
MARRNKLEAKPRKKPIEQYEHKGKERLNNPPVGLVDARSEVAEGRRKYAYDPHLDPTLQWAGKAERTSFEVPTVSLHVHERIDPRTILEAVRKRNGSNNEQLSLFSSKAENPPLREAIDFYRHKHGWSNRLIAGDSLLVMNSLLEKEELAGQVQMVYIDPPYGIRYGSNFQPFVNKRDVKDGKDEDLTAEPEMIKAFRDTWELGIHSYLSYLRDRLLLVRELLHASGSVFVQISDENVHRVRDLLDEVFGAKNFVSQISFNKTGGATSELLASIADIILWYARDKTKAKFHRLFETKELIETDYDYVLERNGSCRRLNLDEKRDPKSLPGGSQIYGLHSLKSAGFRQNTTVEFTFEGETFHPGMNYNWKTTLEGLQRLAKLGRIEKVANGLRYRRFFVDFPVSPVTNLWAGGGASDMVYVVQTSARIVGRCLLMTTDPGDLVLDITCGSGTTAYIAEQWGRRWITCDTSRVAVTLAKQRLMTAVYDYYQLAHPEEGVGSGFLYKTVPHVTLKSIANNEPPEQEMLHDQPLIDSSRMRVTGPFTVEAVPAPMVKSPAEFDGGMLEAAPSADESVSRSGETLRQDQWRSELLRSGIRGKGGQMILFSRVEPLAGTRWLHAEAETKPNEAGRNQVREGAAREVQHAVISFGPEHAPLEQKQVEMAFEESRKLVPRPQIIVFAAFQFDPEAAKDIDETHISGITLLKVQMNADLLTDDLKKKRSSNESFWLIGQPDVVLRKIQRSEHQGMWEVEVHGFDYYNTKTGAIESGGSDKIALWMLDTDYDGRSLFPRQVFFPMSGEKDGWSKLARNLRAEIDEELIESYRGTVSLPFPAGKHSRVAVKIVDDRGIESLKVLEM